MKNELAIVGACYTRPFPAFFLHRDARSTPLHFTSRP